MGSKFLSALIDSSHDETITSFTIAVSDQTSNLETGTGVMTFQMPFGFELTEIPKASVKTVATGSTIIFDINVAGSTILSTKLSIDISETGSSSASTPAVLSSTSIANNAIVSIDIDQIGSTNTGIGALIYLIGRKTWAVIL